MSEIEIVVPDLGVEGTVEVIEICVETGARVAADDALVVLESDKATMEVPLEVAGTISSLAVKAGDHVKQGDRLALIEVGGGAEDDAASLESKEPKTSVESDLDLESSSRTGLQAASIVDVSIPDLGGAESVEIVEILLSVGDEIELDQTILVLESDKATMEIPSAVAGTVVEVSVSLGGHVSEGDVVARVSSLSGSINSAAPASDDSVVGIGEAVKPEKRSTPSLPVSTVLPSSNNAHAGPAVRKLARELGVQLALVAGSGRKGRVLKDDVKMYVKGQLSSPRADAHPNAASTSFASSPLPDFSMFGDVERVALSKLQAVTAANMHRSWLQVPHVTQFDEADITEFELFRKSRKSEAEARGLKITPLPFLLKACAHALTELPQFNVSLDMESGEIVRKFYVHIGIAVDTPAGLVVPVVRDVDKKSIWELARECGELASKARDRKLTPSDMQGGCFTVSSLGSIGGTAFTPIVNSPEVAILGVSKSFYKPVYRGDTFIPRLMLPLSLSYDHRAVNGVDGARFTAHVAKVLGDLRELVM